MSCANQSIVSLLDELFVEQLLAGHFVLAVVNCRTNPLQCQQGQAGRQLPANGQEQVDEQGDQCGREAKQSRP